MSTLLSEAIIDAKALREAALKNAETAVIEKYSQEVKETLDNLLEQEEIDLGAPLGGEEPPADALSDLGGDEAAPDLGAETAALPAEAVEGADRSRIHTFLATSDLHLEHKLHMSREQCQEAAVDGVKLARQYTDNVQFSAEDALRTDIDFLCQVVEATISAGATTINLPDTVGYSTPDEIFDFFTTIITRVPNSDKAVFSAHCHDDLGLAVANTLAALRAGVRQVECTINGIGERAGNASLEEIVMATRVRPDRLPFATGINTEAIYETSQLLSALTGEAVQANKAIVGRNAFAHEAGIHQDGMLKDRRTYEIMKPEDVGVSQTTLVLGKHSGRHAVQNRCVELGYELSRYELDQVYQRMIRLADAQKTVGDEDLVAMIETVHVEETESESTAAGVKSA